MLNNLKSFLKFNYKNHRILIFTILILFLRLLLNFDSCLLRRDIDFLPISGNPSAWLVNEGRYFCLIVNYLIENITKWTPLLIKHIFGKLPIIIYIPIFIALATSFKFNNYQKAIALILFLGNSAVFYTYDNLGPYFILVLFSSLQIIFLFRILEKKDSLLCFFMTSMFLLATHWISLLQCVLCIGVMIFHKNNVFKNKFNLSLLIILIITYLSFIFIVLQEILAGKLRMLKLSYFIINTNSLIFFLKSIFFAFNKMFSTLIGFGFSNNLLFLLLINFLFILIVFKIRNYLPKTKYNLLVILISSYGILYFAYSFANIFFNGFLIINWTIYLVFLIPFLVIALTTFITKIKNKYLQLGIIILLTVLNIRTGYIYRQESFNFKELQNIVTQNNSLKLPYYLIPTNIFHDYSVVLGNPTLGEERFKYNDFHNFPAPPFIIVISEYNELGQPLYNYVQYEHLLEDFLYKNNYSFTIIKFETFRKYIIKN